MIKFPIADYDLPKKLLFSREKAGRIDTTGRHYTAPLVLPRVKQHTAIHFISFLQKLLAFRYSTEIFARHVIFAASSPWKNFGMCEGHEP